MTASPRPTKLTPRSAGAAGLAGLLAGTAGVAAAEAVAALLDGVTSPLLAVANRAVDAAPRPVKEWAIATFGTADKPVLIGGVIGTVALMAAVVGLLALRRRSLGLAGFALLTVVAGAAAVTDRAASASAPVRLLPVLALVVIGLPALLWLLGTIDGRSPTALRRGTLDDRGGPEQDQALPTARGRDLPDAVAGDELPPAFDRRAFLRAAVAVSAIAGAGGLIRTVAGGAAAVQSRAALRVPSPDVAAPAVPARASLPVGGITPYLTSNRDFYRVDTALQVPDVPVDGWRLRIHGLVDRELDLSYEDLLSRRLVEKRVTLTCVSNEVGGELAGNATWIGVPLRDLLEEAGVQDGADAVKSTSADDFTAGTPLDVLRDPAREAMLAVAMNGEPLPLAHGFPVRMVTPGLYGYVSATKWLVDLEVTRFADFEAYWTSRGYAAQAPIKTASRIDVPRSFARVKPGRTPVAGVAWAQARGIERVEVRVDEGPWNQARLAAQDSIDTWRQWVWEWDATPGNHRLEVRATDATGETQTPERAPIAPDGSTGWHSVTVLVE